MELLRIRDSRFNQFIETTTQDIGRGVLAAKIPPSLYFVLATAVWDCHSESGRLRKCWNCAESEYCLRPTAELYSLSSEAAFSLAAKRKAWLSLLTFLCQDKILAANRTIDNRSARKRALVRVQKFSLIGERAKKWVLRIGVMKKSLFWPMVFTLQNRPVLHLLSSKNFKNRCFDPSKRPILRIFRKKWQNNLERSRKAAIFAPAKRKEHGSNGQVQTFAQRSLEDWNYR